MITIKVRDYRGFVHDFSAEKLVNSTMDSACSGGAIEALDSQLATLASMVGKLVEKLPTSEWIDVVGAYHLEEVKE